MARLVLLVTSPRVGPGLLTREAWSVLGVAGQEGQVLGRDVEEPLGAAVTESGIAVVSLPDLDPLPLARQLLDRAIRSAVEVVWLGSSDGDPGLTDALAAEVSRRSDPPDVEVLVGSYDIPGSRLLDLVAVMDRLRSPGGCPWDAQQTHASLAPYLLEEAHEAVEAIEGFSASEAEGRDHLVEELGDVLLQVAFHARIGEENAARPFDIDDVASGIVAKLVRRHPHVFAGGAASTAGEVEAGWEELKAAEKPERSSVLDGIPAGVGSLALAAKVVSRLERAGGAAAVEEVVARQANSLGARLLALVLEAREAGVDPEAALRAAVREVARLSDPGPTTTPTSR